MHYKIAKDSPLPKSGRSFGNFLPLKDMEVGNSFSFPAVDEKRVTALIDAYGKKNGAAFRVVVSEGKSECWRIS